MNYIITNELFGVIKPYTENVNITISTENIDWKGEKYKSDFVTIDEKNNFGFEVFDNEIIVFYFTDHCHFEDYTSDLEDGNDDYIKRAKDFIIKLFENKIKYVQIYKGKKLVAEKYYIIYADNKEEEIGNTLLGLAHLVNPFTKKMEKTTIYQFNPATGCFDIVQK
jgi:hypothetical protein